MLRKRKNKKMLKGVMLRFLCLFLLIGCPIFQATIAGQEQTWKLKPVGSPTIEMTGHEEDLRRQNVEQLRWVNLIFLGILLLTGLQIYKRCSPSVYFSQKEMLQLKEQRRNLLNALVHLDDQYARGAYA